MAKEERFEIGLSDLRIELKINKKHPDGGHYKESTLLRYKEAKKLKDKLEEALVALRVKIKEEIE